ncbi:hypothetical protein [Granulicella sibirica]|uniref:hypothetical protein n=1 Tax=Granulicella sibirica TaxID=2479048 RepID=UPI001008939F|nr:hypothetical protein [Granulicella sibirica]
MTNEEIRTACERAVTIANTFEYADLRTEVFGAVLSRLLQEENKNASAKSDSYSVTEREPIAKKAQKTAKAPKTRARGGLTSRLKELIADGFFGNERTTIEISEALRVAGWNHQSKEISARLIELVRGKQLRRAGGKDSGYRYSNW